MLLTPTNIDPRAASNRAVQTFPGQSHDYTPHSADRLQQPGRRSNRQNIFSLEFDGLSRHWRGNELFTAQFPQQFLSNERTNQETPGQDGQ